MSKPFLYECRCICLIFLIFGLFFTIPKPAFARDTLSGPVQGTVLRVLDGDTIDVRLHVWIGQDIETHVRIAGIDAPEIHGKCTSERIRAQASKNALIALLSSGRVILYNVRFAKYAGRVLAEAQTAKGVLVSSYMLKNGFARVYFGEKRMGWCG